MHYRMPNSPASDKTSSASDHTCLGISAVTGSFPPAQDSVLVPSRLNVSAVAELLKVLREFGVTEYSNCGLTLKMVAQLPDPLVKAPAELTDDQQKDIMKKIETMKSVMQLDDDNLIDRLFPAESEEGLSGV